MLVELGKNQNVYKLCNIPGVTVRPKRGKDECLGRPGCGFKAVATELFRTVASELSLIVLNIFQLGCTTRPHCPPQDWLPYCLYPPCTLDNCHSLCPCLAVCLSTVALDHLCTFVPLYLCTFVPARHSIGRHRQQWRSTSRTCTSLVATRAGQTEI